MVRLHADASAGRLNRLAAVLIALLALSLLAPSCAQKRLERRQAKAIEELGVVSEKFNRFLQWRDYDSAMAFVAQEYREAYICGTDKLAANLSIESIAFVNAEVAPYELDPELTYEENIKLGNLLEGRLGRVSVRYLNVSLLPSSDVASYRQMQYYEYRNERWVLLPDWSWILGKDAWDVCLEVATEPTERPARPVEDPFKPPPAPAGQ
ncbi:MAG: hypothetical protein P9M14_15985 [Candidatus Alcyoniella australis]|nr:hypothetical protein [Candidatus Alcyoniella australis]